MTKGDLSISAGHFLISKSISHVMPLDLLVGKFIDWIFLCKMALTSKTMSKQMIVHCRVVIGCDLITKLGNFPMEGDGGSDKNRHQNIKRD